MSALERLIPQLAVFPLWSTSDGVCQCWLCDNCDAPGKHPRAKWSELGVADKWGNDEDPDCEDFGIATGRRSGVWVLDLDHKPNEGRDGIANFLRWTLGREVPDTFTVATPSGGLHLYWLLPDFEVRTSGNELAQGVDIRGEGGFAVAPGSKHKNGGIYSVARDIDPVQAPYWLLSWRKLRKKEEGEGIPVEPIIMTDDEKTFRVSRARQKLREMRPSVEGQQGSKAMLAACQYLVLDEGFSDGDAKTLIVEEYNPRAQGPWNEREIDYKIDQARNRSKRKRRLLIGVRRGICRFSAR